MALSTALSSLEFTGLIELFKTQPELEYQFRHALVQEAAYESLLKRDRQLLHRAIAEALEHAYPDQLDRHAALLAHHFAKADDVERAFKYYARAGDVAARLYANAEAIHHYGHAIQLVQQIELPTERLAELYLQRGRVLELHSDYDAALANYRELETLAHTCDDRSMQLASLIAQATIHAIPSTELDAQQGRALSERALVLAQELGDRAGEAQVLWNLMLVATFAEDRSDQAVEYGERALVIAREHGTREQLAFILHDMVRPYATIGQFTRAWEVLDEVRHLWRELGNLPMLADSLETLSEGHLYLGEFEQSIAAAQQATDISRSIDNLWGQANAQSAIGLAYAERGDVSAAIHAWMTAIALGQRGGFAPPAVYARVILALLYGRMGDFENAFRLVDEALAQPHAAAGRRGPFFPRVALAWLYFINGDLIKADAALHVPEVDLSLLQSDFVVYAFAATLAGEVELANGAIDRALVLAESAIVTLRRSGMRAYLADALHLKATVLLKSREYKAGSSLLAEARNEATAIGSRRALLPILMTLIRIEAERGNSVESTRLRQQAREVIDYIAAHIDESDLRLSFLMLPDNHDIIKDEAR